MSKTGVKRSHGDERDSEPESKQIKIDLQKNSLILDKFFEKMSDNISNSLNKLQIKANRVIDHKIAESRLYASYGDLLRLEHLMSNLNEEKRLMANKQPGGGAGGAGDNTDYSTHDDQDDDDVIFVDQAIEEIDLWTQGNH